MIVDRNRTRNRRIPFLINGAMQVTRTVTKNTTCNDVIAKLPNMAAPLAVYEYVDGIERELPGKTKLLKLWHNRDPSKSMTFTVRKTDRPPSCKRRKILGLDISRLSRTSNKTPVKTAAELSKEQLKKVSDLAVYSRFQKAKILAMQINSANSDMDSTQQAGNGLTKQMTTSSTSLSSMDAFLSRVNLQEMSELMNYCSDVSVKFLERHVKQKRIGQCTGDDTYVGDIDETREEVTVVEEVQTIENNIASPKPTRFFDMDKIKTSLKTKKLGLKAKFNTLAKSKSSSSIRSNDTGYHSIGSKGENDDDISGNKRDSVAVLTHDHVEDEDFAGLPRHSTPSTNRSVLQCSRDSDNDVTLTADSVNQYTENGGKSVIFNKFMTDRSQESYTHQRTAQSTRPSASGDSLQENVSIRRTSAIHPPMFNSQREKCEFYWSSNCDSDSDSSYCQSDISSDSIHNLDTAFVEISNCGLFMEPVNTLRRESAESNLMKPSLRRKSVVSDLQKHTLRRESAVLDLKKHSIDHPHARRQTVDFDYSFNCSFPFMEDFQSANFSDSSSDTDDNYSQDDLDTQSESSADDCLESFMRTRSSLYISDDDLDVTVSANCTGYTNTSSCTSPLLKRKRLVTFGDEIHL